MNYPYNHIFKQYGFKLFCTIFLLNFKVIFFSLLCNHNFLDYVQFSDLRFDDLCFYGYCHPYYFRIVPNQTPEIVEKVVVDYCNSVWKTRNSPNKVNIVVTESIEYIIYIQIHN